MFESSVNPEGSKTGLVQHIYLQEFESSVNPEGSKTNKKPCNGGDKFESSVNPEDSKTSSSRCYIYTDSIGSEGLSEPGCFTYVNVDPDLPHAISGEFKNGRPVVITKDIRTADDQDLYVIFCDEAYRAGSKACVYCAVDFKPEDALFYLTPYGYKYSTDTDKEAIDVYPY